MLEKTFLDWKVVDKGAVETVLIDDLDHTRGQLDGAVPPRNRGVPDGKLVVRFTTDRDLPFRERKHCAVHGAGDRHKPWVHFSRAIHLSFTRFEALSKPPQRRLAYQGFRRNPIKTDRRTITPDINGAFRRSFM